MLLDEDGFVDPFDSHVIGTMLFSIRKNRKISYSLRFGKSISKGFAEKRIRKEKSGRGEGKSRVR